MLTPGEEEDSVGDMADMPLSWLWEEMRERGSLGGREAALLMMWEPSERSVLWLTMQWDSLCWWPPLPMMVKLSLISVWTERKRTPLARGTKRMLMGMSSPAAWAL